ncbi:MAG: hypothetical protein EXR83_12910 [Gammaproteobacteria bacterium]|nr:hypothetical protein [Gammaproteobacteria bacterium]
MVTNKVAQVTASFWALKICATTLGETAGDWVSMTQAVGYGASCVLLLGVFALLLAGQLLLSRFNLLLYWAVILASSTAGTTLSDFMDRSLGLGYATGALLLTLGLAGVLLAWRTVEGGLSVSHIATRRAEVFYWAAILFSNTLGTAVGDYLADDIGLGFLGGAGLTGGLLVLVCLVYRYTTLSRVTLFWLAFVLTRPFGATFGDSLTKSTVQGGLGFGTVGASLVLFSLLAAGLVILRRQERAAASG